jgi:ketosteroid isomerase-like protein
MSPVPRAVVEAFYHALSVRDMAALANFLATWCGPSADPSTFCRSARVGKYLVMKLLGRDSPTLWSRRRFVATTMLVDGDRASVLGRLTGTKRASGQAISYRIAHFIQFRDEKVIDYVWIIDSFDSVEQLLGYNLDAYDGYRVEGNVVTV